MASLHHLVTVIMEVVTGSNNHQTKNMQMKRNFIYLIGVICLMTSCIGELNTNKPSADGDIVFTASLSEVTTRTLYDEEGIKNASGAVKVNWVHNDLITIYGADCTEGRQQAEYRVGAVKVNGSNVPVLDANGNEQPVSGQSYANYLQKTGAAGVQWGSKNTSDFYAVYPSTDKTFEKTSNGAKVRTKIRDVQGNVFKFDEDRNCWVGRPYVDNADNPTMVDALMYAYASGKASDGNVQLNFKPWTTALKFRFEGFHYDLVGAAQKSVNIKKIILQAPADVKIAGDVELAINKSTKTATTTPYGTNVSNTITIAPDYLPMKADEAVEFCVFTIPTENLKFGVSENKDLWKVRIETADGQAFTYKLRPSSGNANLVAGKIHKVTIPSLHIEKPGDLTGDKNHWIEKIPRNVYLSELSVPGSWYCFDSNYSGNTDLQALYDGGVRAFHIDCRQTSNKLYCAGTEGQSTPIEVATQLTRLNSIINGKNEYIVVVLTVAEKTYNSNSGSSVKPADVLPKIATLLNSSTLTNLYRNEITPNTTVGDVLGKMIVIVNTNTNNFTSIYNAPSLTAEASLAPSASSSDNIVAGNFTSMQTRDLYWGNKNSGMKYHYHHAQRTTTNNGNVSGVPGYGNRKTAIDDIISRSDDIYLASTHNCWYMMGIGGYRKNSGWFQSENHTEVASTMNTYLLDWIERKLSKEEGMYPSPVGVVLMNYPLNRSYSGPQLIEAIINMNAAFRLAADPDRDEETGEVLPDVLAGWAEVSAWDDVTLN